MWVLATFVTFVTFAFATAQNGQLYIPPLGLKPPPLRNFDFLGLPSTSNMATFRLLSPRLHNNSTCNPPPIHKIVQQSAWRPIQLSDRQYIVLASGGTDEWTNFIGDSGTSPGCPGSRRRDDDNCLTVTWNSTASTAAVTSYDGCAFKETLIRCESLHYERFIARCVFPSNNTVVQHVFQTDGQLWQLGYECWTVNGRQLPPTWSLYSTYKTIPNSLRRQIQTYVAEVGFDPDNIRQPNHDACPNLPKVGPTLVTRPKFFKQPPQYCSPPTNILSSGTSWHLEKKDDLLYYPLVYSQHESVVDLSNTLEPPTCQPTLSEPRSRKKFCLASKFNSATFHSQFQYYDGCQQYFKNESCSQLEPGKLSSICDLPGGGTLKQYGVLGDNHTYILMYECWSHKLTPVTWSLRSISKRLPESLKLYVLDYVQRVLGFDYHDYREPDYSNCPTFR